MSALDEALVFEILSAVEEIPPGRVASYGQIAGLVGRPRNARLVGRVLRTAELYGEYPCHRVVNARGFCSGSFSFGGADSQRRKLEAEGVAFKADHVDMQACAITEDDFEQMSAELQKQRQ